MANYPVKLLKDKDGTAFIPVVNSDSIITPEGDTLNDLLEEKQDTLVSGTNIKTINGNSLLGSGDITISGGSESSGDLTDFDNIAIVTGGNSTITNSSGTLTIVNQKLHDLIAGTETFKVMFANTGTYLDNLSISSATDRGMRFGENVVKFAFRYDMDIFYIRLEASTTDNSVTVTLDGQPSQMAAKDYVTNSINNALEDYYDKNDITGIVNDLTDYVDEAISNITDGDEVNY